MAKGRYYTPRAIRHMPGLIHKKGTDEAFQLMLRKTLRRPSKMRNSRTE